MIKKNQEKSTIFFITLYIGTTERSDGPIERKKRSGIEIISIYLNKDRDNLHATHNLYMYTHYATNVTFQWLHFHYWTFLLFHCGLTWNTLLHYTHKLISSKFINEQKSKMKEYINIYIVYLGWYIFFILSASFKHQLIYIVTGKSSNSTKN